MMANLKINEESLEKHMDMLSTIRRDIESELVNKTRSMKQKKNSSFFKVADNSSTGAENDPITVTDIDRATSIQRSESMASTVILSRSYPDNVIYTYASSESSTTSIKEINVPEGNLTEFPNPPESECFEFSGFEDTDDDSNEITNFADQKQSLVPCYSDSDDMSSIPDI